jgi:DNA-binding response OmpR family regulator
MNKHNPLAMLVVEDDEGAREILASVLALKFPAFAIHSADNGETGLESFRTYLPAIVITDINMPVMDGISMAGAIKSIDAGVKLIVLTAYSDKVIQKDTTTIEIDHYIPKPADYSKLFAAVEQCIEGIAPNAGKESKEIVRAGSQADAPIVADLEAPMSCLPDVSMRVLVVDDDSDVRESLSLLLEQYGYEVKMASCGESAMIQFEAFQPEAVLLDIGLPGEDGYQVARRIRNLPSAKDLLLVAVSGHTSDLKRSHQAGFDHHLVKPVIFAMLWDLLSARARNMR